MNGTTTTGALSVPGSATVTGNVQAGSANISNALTANTLSASSATISGGLSAGSYSGGGINIGANGISCGFLQTNAGGGSGEIDTVTLRASGAITATGDISGGTLSVAGTLMISNTGICLYSAQGSRPTRRFTVHRRDFRGVGRMERDIRQRQREERSLSPVRMHSQTWPKGDLWKRTFQFDPRESAMLQKPSTPERTQALAAIGALSLDMRRRARISTPAAEKQRAFLRQAVMTRGKERYEAARANNGALIVSVPDLPVKLPPGPMRLNGAAMDKAEA